MLGFSSGVPLTEYLCFSFLKNIDDDLPGASQAVATVTIGEI